MGFSLESCPGEVIELILSSLELKDIRNLRLASRSVSDKSWCGRFRRLCQSKHVDIAVTSLRAFTADLQSLSNLPQVEHLYLVGLSWKNKKPNHQREEKAEVFIEALKEMTKSGRDGRLKSLTLEVAVPRRNRTRSRPAELKGRTIPKRVWSCTVETWQLTLRGLAESQLRVEKLNAFNGECMQRCSIPCDRLGIAPHLYPGLKVSFKALQFLSVSICDRVFKFGNDAYESDGESNYFSRQAEEEERPDPTRNSQAEAIEENNFSGVSELIDLCPNITHLELHYFHMFNRILNVMTEFPSEKTLKRVLELKNLPRLIGCTLRGVTACEKDLLNFILRTKPSDLSLQTIRLIQGNFSSIIEHCTTGGANIKTLLFDNLKKPDGEGYYEMVHFPGRESSRAAIPNASERIIREGDAVKQPMLYSVSRPIHIGSPTTVEYRRYQRLEYGG